MMSEETYRKLGGAAKPPSTFNPNAPNAAKELAARGATLLGELMRLGIFPLHDPADLLLLSILPLAIKKILTGDPSIDQQMLVELVDQLDLTELARLIHD